MFEAVGLRSVFGACILAAMAQMLFAREYPRARVEPKPSATKSPRTKSSAARQNTPLDRGDSSRQSQEEAVRAIPRRELDRKALAAVNDVLDNVTIYRRLPTQTIECDPEFFEFLVDHPDVVVALWRAMGVSAMTLSQDESGGFTANDAAGTKARVEYLHAGPEVRLLLADGKYHGALFTRPVEGRCLLLLRTRFSREASGKRLVTCRLDAFLQVKHIAADLLARTFQPLVGQTADHNFRETTSFLEKLQAAAVTNHAAVCRIGDKMDGVPVDRKQEFMALSEAVAVRSALARRRPPSSTVAKAAPQAAASPQSRPVQTRAAAAPATTHRGKARSKASTAKSKPGVIVAKGRRK